VDFSAKPYTILLKKPFKIASGTRSSTPIVLVEIKHENQTGYGEASLPPYLGESQESVLNFYEKINFKSIKSLEDINGLLYFIDEVSSANNAAKAAIDIALHDLIAKIKNLTLAEFLKVKNSEQKPTSITIGLNDASSVLEEVKKAEEFDYVKIKMGSKYDKEVAEHLAKFSTKKFCIDINRGWTNKYFALEILKILEGNNLLYLEQPFDTNMIKETIWLSDRSPVPIIADESVKRLSDIKDAEGIYHGINIKLMKSTGLNEALKMIELAKKKEMKIVLGSMTETSCAQSAAAQISSLADWVDLDSQFLISNDCFDGVKIVDGKIIVKKELPGIAAIKH
jgi:L-Ala-D/L-Glu epimerase